MKPQFGIFAVVQVPERYSVVSAWKQTLAEVQTAVRGGFDSILVGHHYLASPYQMLQPLLFLARLVPETGRMRLGTGVLLLPLLNPVAVAEETATLDVLSGGRFIFGVGLGYRAAEDAAFRVWPPEKVGRFLESLTIVQRLWRGESVDFDGRYFHLQQAKASVRPLQRPGPPIWIAANHDKAVERVGRLGHAWFVNPHAALPTLRKQMDLYLRALRQSRRRRPEELPLFREAFVASSEDEAWSTAGAFLAAKYRSYSAWGQDQAFAQPERFDRPVRELGAGRFVVGSPEQCIESLARYQRELGANHFVLRMRWPGLRHAATIESLRLFGERVLPYFHDGRQR
jgi:alkanesulfonate monooxygenase SsuD/methylene tetrahydromethanopterin reductase-like flavin-dependent oxidoreductase (luciferase family)